MPEPTAKLILKVGDKEVHLEAGIETVRSELDRLASRLLSPDDGDEEPVLSVTAPRPRKSRSKRRPKSPAERAIRPGRTAVLPAMRPAGAEQLEDVTLDPNQSAELYAVNADGEIGLRKLPQGDKPEADVLLLLLYGMLVFQGRSPATAPALLRAARESGLKIDRAHRILAKRAHLVEITGRRRGKRYRLKGAGVSYCEDLIRKLLPATPS
jgi:hypothetical protein